MFWQIKSTLYFAFLVLVVGALTLNIGCSDTSSRRNDMSDRNELASRQHDADVSRLTERRIAAMATMQSDTQVFETSSKSTSPEATSFERVAIVEQPLTLPKTINWDIPEEIVASAQDKITAETVKPEVNTTVSNLPDSNNRENAVVTAEQNQPPQTEETIQGTNQREDDANPFAAIVESLNSTEPQDAVVPLPATDDAIDEGIWEKAQSIDHDLLERLVIKKTDDTNNWRLQPNVPVDQKMPSDKASSDSSSQSDTEWQAIEPNTALEIQPPPEPVPTPEWNPAPEPELKSEPEHASEVVATEESEVADQEPIIDLTATPALPNVQTDDSDFFGIDASAAFEQFGQTVGDSTATPPATPNITTQQPTQQDDLGFDGWGDAEPFDPGIDTTTPQPTVTPEPSTPPAAKPTQPQPTPGTQDDPGATETLTPVEKYLVNEAKASPVKLMESVELLYKLNKPTLARRLLRQLMDKELSEEDCRQINKRINPAIMLRISLDDEYQPEGGLVVRKIVDNSQKYFESRSTIEDAMQRLLTGTDREKDDAVQTILSGGETSIEFLLERLAKTTDTKELSEIMSLLNAMGESARRALQESLVPTTPLGMRAARLLTQMGRASDSRFLLPMMFDSRLNDDERREVAGMTQTLSRNVPNQESAAATLYAMASNYFRGKVPFMTDADKNVSLWILKEGAELPKFVTIHEDEASRYFAEKFARYAHCIDPQKPAYRQLWLVTFFDLKGSNLGNLKEADLSTNNSIKYDEKLLRDMLNGLSIDDVESALRFAMLQDHPIAARVAAELMGEIGDVEAIIYKRGSQSALVKAAGFSDRRVRFAALQSIIKLNPDRPYPGSSVVTQSLVYFTRATGQKRAVVVCPWLGDATAIANLLAPLGYTSETATMGRQAMQLAIDSADTELMMLDVRTPNSDVAFLVQDMRADNRTHDIPIAVLANGYRVSRAERAAYSDNRLDATDSQETDSPENATNRFIIGDDEFLVERDMMTKAQRAAYGSKMAHAFPRPYDEASAQFVIENLLHESGVEHVPPQIRLAEAKQSIQWVTELYQKLYQKSKLYHFENIEQIAWDTLWLPELTDVTLPLVELIPTANAQRMLTHIVSTADFPINTRQSALKAFENNAGTNGILIRGQQILDLYDMYNASGTEAVASQQARSDLLDVVEKYANYMQNVNYQK